MKGRLICFILLISIFLSACNSGYNAEICYFHYPNLQSGQDRYESVIGYETKNIPLEGRDYKEILNEYLRGPSGNNLLNPYPVGSVITAVDISNKRVTVSLNSKFSLLKESDFSLSCACLVKTVFSLIPSQTVVLKAQNTFSDGSIYKAYSSESFLTDDNAKELGITSISED
jgi:hypothetical protein